MARTRGLALAFAFVTALAGACDSSPPANAPPPRVCKAPPAGSGGFPWFVDATAKFGLAPSETTNPVANVIIAADFDGDGWSDLLTMAPDPNTGRSSARGAGLRHLYFNRPNPSVPGARIFVDATADSGLLATRDGAGDRGFSIANAGDLDDDGDVDLVLCPADEIFSTYAPDDPCDAFLNDGAGHFTLAPPSDLDSKVHWYPSGTLLDYDQDGVLDFWPATIAHWPYDPNGPNRDPPTLYRGNGDGTFANVSAQVGLPTSDGLITNGTQWRHVFGIVACDLDGDGDDDVIFADYGREENQVWQNDGGTFTNVAHDLGVDQDDRQDYSDDQSFRCWCEANPTSSICNPLPPAPIVDCCAFCKQNNPPLACPSVGCPPYFRWQPNVSDKSYSLGGNYFSFACGDIDNDGRMDLLGATIQHGDVGSSEDPSELLLGAGGGKFVRPGNDADGLARPEPPSRGLYWNHGDDLMVMVDVDLDGWKDIFSTTTGAYEVSDTHRLWRQVSPGKFQEIEYPAGLLANGDLPNLHGPAWIDIDGDGDLDLVVGDTRSGGIHVYENLVGQNQNWVRVRLVGGGPGAANTSAIGAVVKVTAGGLTQTEYVSGGYGHGNVQADLALTFGLGSACDVDSIEVDWPDAAHSVSTFTNVRANYAVTLHQGSPEVVYAH